MGKFSIKINNQKSQSLVELVIGIGLGVVFLGIAAGSIALILRNNLEARTSQIAASLAQEYLDGVSAIGESNWLAVYNPPAAKGISSQFYLDISGGNYAITGGTTSTIIESRSFTRYFSIENANRESCGVDNATTTTATSSSCLINFPGSSTDINEDPSTQKITATVEWDNGRRKISLAKYLTRTQNTGFKQSDWSGGSGQESFPASGVNNKFTTSTDVVAGADLQIREASSFTSYYFTDDGTISTNSTIAAGGGFLNGTNANTIVSGLGVGASVKLSISPWASSSVAQTPDTIYYGGALVSTGGDFLYGYRGYSNEFYRYSISNNSWTSIATTSADIGVGGALVYTGEDFIYGYRGNLSRTFYRYSISGNSWTTMNQTPENIGFGGALVYTGSYIYGYRGNDTANFYRYTIGGSWTSMTPVMGGAGTISSGGALVYTGSYIYGYRGGNTRDFYRYTTSTDSWTQMDPTPGVIDNSGGGALVYPGSGDFIYGTSGGGTNKFYRYSISNNSWTSISQTPGGIGDGAALAYPGSGDYIYGYRGGNTRDFYRYSISSDSNFGILIAPTPAPVGSGGSLAYDGSGNIYALRGGDTTSFWKYSISGNSWTVMASTTAAVDTGGALAYDNSGNIYAVRGGNTSSFYRYSISGNSWSTVSSTPISVSNGGALVYGGSGNMYHFSGFNSPTRFSRYTTSTNTWTGMASTTLGVSDGAALVYNGGNYIYGFRGDNTTDFYRYSISDGTWNYTKAPALGNIYYGGSLAYPGSGDYIYGLAGNYTDSFYRYSISGNSWTSMVPVPVNIGPGGALAYPGSGDYMYGLRGQNTTDFFRFSFTSYPSSGNFTSATIDFGAATNFNTLSPTSTVPSQTGSNALRIQLATSNLSSGPWTYYGPNGATNTYYSATTTNQAIWSGHNSDRYLRYKVYFQTANNDYTPSFNSVTINYGIQDSILYYAVNNANLTSSVFDSQTTGGAAINSIMWKGSLNGGEVKFQIASSNNSNGPWDYKGPDGTGNTYYNPGSPDASSKINLMNHNNQRYFRYKIFLYTNSDMTQSPIVDDVIINWSP